MFIYWMLQPFFNFEALLRRGIAEAGNASSPIAR